ncbi:type VI secretion system tip protein VgrG [Mucilaginibacter sp.]|uniref:type VI secretion system tip protein VgrG n=1 Tax=Mucilaginibacter sp. TaxID=1882438 RepID=UPI00261E06D9|nr:type VI secretion system tip protein VgrG [Mucilaginibacter sp.]MDB4918394.1 hypothetical protein [Mucilaginibacter sp.]
MSSITYTITSDSKAMPATYKLLSISVSNEVNRISYAEMVLIDGDYSKQVYSISDGDFFDPGKKISISIREEGEAEEEKVIFKGSVVTQSLRYDQGNSLLTVEMSDDAIKMTTIKQSDIFKDIKDSELIEGLISRSGVNKGTVDDTKFKHERIVQYHTTNWDMLLSRADVNGLLVTTVNGKVSARIPKLSAPSVKTFKLGKDIIYDLDLKLDISDQYAGIQTTTWDEESHTTDKSNVESFNLEQGKLKAADIKKISGDKAERLLALVPLSPEEGKAWAEARMLRTRLSMLRGSFKIGGLTSVNLLDNINLEGMGLKFKGLTMVTGIRHEVTENGWFTHLQFGLGADGLSGTASLTALPASGLLPGINGLQTAIVEDIELDATKRARVKVRMFGAIGADKVVWARMATLGAGHERGMFFWPEKNDEVVLGFINDDPRYPVILGSLYGSKNIPPVPRDKTNTTKGFVSRKGLKLIFDDELQQVSIHTSKGNRILINESKKFIEINDVNKNNITLNAEGIEINTANNLVIKAEGDISIKGKAVKIEGSKIELK